MLSSKVGCLLIMVLLLAGYSHFFVAVHGYTVPKEAKYLVAFFEFEDLSHTKSIDELRDIALTKVQSYYAKVSYGKLKLIADVVPNWIKLPLKVKEMKIFEWDYDNDDMQAVDSTARGRLSQLGIGAGQYVITFIVYAGKVWEHARISVGVAFENEFSKAGVYRHELGHALGHLPDMYSYSLAEEDKPSSVWVGPWDLMSWSGDEGFSSWSLIKLGWLDKNQIIDIREKAQTILTIDALGNATGRVYVARVHLPGTTMSYYLEVRENIGPDADWYSDWYPKLRLGVVIYLVDETWTGESGGESNEGQVKVIDSHPKSYSDPEEDLLDVAFNVGRNANVTLINRGIDLSMIVLAGIGYSHKIMLADAATGDKATEANNIIVAAEQATSKAQAESRLKGLDEANSQLSKAKSAYGESQFANAIQAAKNAIELANAATKIGTPTSTLTATEQQTMSAPTQITAPLLASQPVTVIALVLIGAVIAGLVVTVSKRRRLRKES